MIRVGINGIGRIGKLVFRMIHHRNDMEVVVVNDLMPMVTLIHLLRYDSVHRAFGRAVSVSDDPTVFRVNGHTVKKYAHSQPHHIPWHEYDVNVVIDASGRFLTYNKLMGHLQQGVKKVILSCPPEEPLDSMVVLGVNEHTLKPEDKIISNASCTTNCIAPVLKLIDEKFGIDRAMMNTVHPYTNSQNVLDGPHSDLRRARCANENIIPTTTSAIKAVQTIMPHLKDRFDGFATRVPVSDGSFVELTALLKQPVCVEALNQMMLDAANGEMKGIVAYCDDPVVSTDIIGDPHSAIFDALSTKVLGGNMIQILVWYDNEFGYSNRIVELIDLVMKDN